MSDGYERFRQKTLEDNSFPLYRDHVVVSILNTPVDGQSFCTTIETITRDFTGLATRLVTQTMVDWVTPSYTRRSARGEVICKPMSKTKITKVVHPVNKSEAFTRSIPSYYGDELIKLPAGDKFLGDEPSTLYLESPDALAARYEFLDVDIEGVKSLAVTQAHANIKVNEADILASLGESKETIVYLRTVMLRAVRVFRAIKHLDIKFLMPRKKWSKKDMAELYMEQRYALRPLIMDAQNAVKAFTASKNIHDRQTYRGYSSDREDGTPVETTHTNGTWTEYTSRTTGYREVSARAGVLCSLDDLSPLQLWGADKPIEAMWELLPFSFIADWFFNIGQTIESWTPNYGIHDLASWVTVKNKLHCESRITNSRVLRSDSYWNYDNYYSLNNGLVTYESETLTRYVNPNRKIVPQFKLRLDPFKILDLAIIIKMLTSHKGKRY